MGQFASAAMLVANTVQSAQQAKQQKAAAMARQRADIQQRQYQLEIQEREKRDRLKRAEAAQRAHFGSQGMGAGSGSAAALLQGLRKETEQSIADMWGLENMRTDRINKESARRRRLNLLEHRNGAIGQGLGTIVNLLEK